ncbi:MAG: hypothetical protein WD928_03805 [Gammaproteobacteria bacterium]
MTLDVLCPRLLILCAVLTAGGCAGPATAPLTAVPVAPAAVDVPDELLLDVNIAILDPGIENLDPKRATTTPGIRRAEGHYVALRLRDTLAATRQWGLVRVTPDATRIVDVMVSGRILESDGRTLEVEFTAHDSRSETWFTRTYEEHVSRYAYDMEIRRRQEPFQNLYNRVADDLRAYLDSHELSVRRTIRDTSALRFAAKLAPDAFDDHLESSAQGKYTIRRLPAVGDPLLARVARIRVRDEAFIDHLQEAYDTFDRDMNRSYDHWREESYDEAEAADDLKSQALLRTIGGALAVVGGVLAQTSGNAAVRNAGVIGIGGGAYSIYSGAQKRADARIHTAALKELSESLNAEVQPATIALTDETIELRGTVEEQYRQWQDLLIRIYRLETGEATSATVPIAD